MVPVPVIGGWHEEQIDELFGSILGQGFESVLQQGDDEDAQTRGGLDEEVNEYLQGGFRVFG